MHNHDQTQQYLTPQTDDENREESEEVDIDIEDTGDAPDSNDDDVNSTDRENQGAETTESIDNINAGKGAINAPQSQAAQKGEGVDNISDEDAELKEDMKADSLGGATQLPETAVEDDKPLPSRPG